MKRQTSLIMVIFVLVSTLLLSGCSQGNNPVSKPLEKREGVIQTNSASIGRELQDDSKKTLEDKYNKKKIQVIGQISKKWIMNDGTICVCIGMQENVMSDKKYYAIRVLMDISQREFVNQYKIGDFVVVSGISGIYEPDENKNKSIFLDIYDAKFE